MIQANELRIGNLVLRYDCVHKVTWIDFTHTGSTLMPIPFTTEILDKAGFKKLYTSIYLYNEKLNLSSLQYDDEKNCVYLEFEGQKCSIELNYVHQLQNLYFTLTGEELEINL